MLNLKITATTLTCLSSAKQRQFTVRKGTCTCTYKLMSPMVHAMVVRLSYTCFMESATVSSMRQILLLTLDVQKPKSFELQWTSPLTPDPDP